MNLLKENTELISIRTLSPQNVKSWNEIAELLNAASGRCNFDLIKKDNMALTTTIQELKLWLKIVGSMTLNNSGLQLFGQLYLTFKKIRYKGSPNTMLIEPFNY